jgi:superfamily I DNA/RNA helicase
MQERLDFGEDTTDKTALLVTFNKSLRNYLSDILSRLLDNPDITDTIKRAIKSITVVNYDSFISNKLKAFSDTYMMSSVIYQKGSKGDYGTLDYVKKVLGESIAKDAQHFYDEEFAWIASQGDMTLERYLAANRRGNRDLSGLDLSKGSDGRKTVFESYERFKAALHDDRRYTVSDITLDLLNRLDRLPKYDIVAIDEAQDFDLIRIKLIYSLRKDNDAKFYIVYDEAQKISKTTFNAEVLDDALPNFTGHGVVFEVNHRNHQDIAAFAARMKDANAALPTTTEAVVLEQENPERIAARVAGLPHAEESIAILMNTNAEISEWASILDGLGVPHRKLNDGDDVTRPGIYLSSLWTVKGLEFDRVIIAQMNEVGSYYYHRTEHDNLYFVAFTRARKALEIYYQGIPHAILEERYRSMLYERDKSMGDLSPTASEASTYDEGIPF